MNILKIILLILIAISLVITLDTRNILKLHFFNSKNDIVKKVRNIATIVLTILLIIFAIIFKK